MTPLENYIRHLEINCKFEVSEKWDGKIEPISMTPKFHLRNFELFKNDTFINIIVQDFGEHGFYQFMETIGENPYLHPTHDELSSVIQNHIDSCQ